MNNLLRLHKAVNWQPVDRLMTYDCMDNAEVLVKHGGYNFNRHYSFDELLEVNVRAFKDVGLDATRIIYDPAHHWMADKIKNWIRFFGVGEDRWEVSQAGGTAWISKRPFSTLKELERHMPNPPKFEEVREWYEPVLKRIQEVFNAYDVAFVGAVEGPISDAYTYTDMELFMSAVYDAPELIAHMLDCTAKFSAYIAQVYAMNPASSLFFMGEDVAGGTGPFLSPSFIREQGLPRWKWIAEPIKSKGIKFLYHTDGRYGELLKIVLEEFGADGLNPIERNGCNDIFEIRDRFPDTLLFGNVCCAVTLPHGNIYDVEDETLEIIEKLGPHGGICIGSSSEVHDLVPVQNAQTMYRVVHEYGRYPIDVERVNRRREAIKHKLSLRHNGVLSSAVARDDQ
jgi:uroporphyrinogen-III decarboxylase